MAQFDSSEIVKHLRSAHLSLVVVCILVWLALSSSSPNVVRTAYEQFQNIISIHDQWHRLIQTYCMERLQWIKEYSEAWSSKISDRIYISPEQLKKEKLPDSDHGWKVRLLYSPIYFHIQIHSNHEVLGYLNVRDDGVEEIIPGGHDLMGPSLFDKRATMTLEDFRDFWDAAGEVQVFMVTEFADVAYLISSDANEVKDLRISKALNPVPKAEVRLLRGNLNATSEIEKCPDKINDLYYSKLKDTFSSYFCAKIPNTSRFLLFPVKVVEYSPINSKNLRSWLGKEFHFSTTGSNFAETFPELNEVSKYYRKETLSNALQILTSEFNRTGERVEFLGLKFPEPVITSWGAGIIVIVQVYFLLHLLTLSVRLTPHDPGLSLPWIGVYAEGFSRGIAWLSIFLLPIFVVGRLMIRNFAFSWSSGAITCLFFIFSLGLAITSGLTLNHIQYIKRLHNMYSPSAKIKPWYFQPYKNFFIRFKALFRSLKRKK